jgi:tripartite-type tricarboxylate transporter receptor subunit TctC
MWAPAGTPKEIVARLSQSLGPILRQPAVVERLRGDGVEPAYTSPDEFARILDSEIGKWSNVIKAGNIKSN